VAFWGVDERIAGSFFDLDRRCFDGEEMTDGITNESRHAYKCPFQIILILFFSSSDSSSGGAGLHLQDFCVRVCA
jgi:hypothetical protein